MKKNLMKSLCLALMLGGTAMVVNAQGIVVHKTDGTKIYYKASEVLSVGVYGYGEEPDTSADSDPEEQDYVEIGGKKWATKNVGATTIAGSYETCFGDYFAWGETEPRYMTMTRTGAYTATFTWKNSFTTGYSSNNYPSYTGTTLDAAHDAATANWGDSWRTPTKEDFQALAMACSGSYSSPQTPITLINTITSGGIYWLPAEQTYEPEYTGVDGFLFVSKADISKRVFFPACSYVNNTNLYPYSKSGYYWSSSPNTSKSAWHVTFGSSNVSLSSSNYRYVGFPIRPVSD